MNEVIAAFGGALPKQHSIDYINRRLHDKTVLIATNTDDVPVGILLHMLWWGDCPFIEFISIQNNYQGRGIGRDMFHTVMTYYRSYGFHRIISSTEVTNLPGQAFHLALGFTPLNSLLLPHGEEIFYSKDI